MKLRLADLGITADTLITLSPAAVTIIDGHGRFVYLNASAAELLGRPVEELVGVPHLDVFEPAHRHLISTRERQRVHVLVPDRCGRDVLVTMFDLVDAYKALIMLDVTESMRAQREATAQSQISARLTHGGDMRATLDSIAANVCTASGCLGCSVVLFESDPVQVKVAGYHNLAKGHNKFFEEACRRDYPLVAVDVFRTGEAKVRTGARALIIESARKMGEEFSEYVKDVSWDTIVSLPLRYDGATTGALNCFYEGTALPPEVEMRFLQSIADQASIVVENARLFAQAEGKAILEERQRLARELHDSVSQALYGIGLGAQTALARIDEGATAREPVEYILDLARSGLAEMRALIFGYARRRWKPRA